MPANRLFFIDPAASQQITYDQLSSDLQAGLGQPVSSAGGNAAPYDLLKALLTAIGTDSCVALTSDFKLDAEASECGGPVETADDKTGPNTELSIEWLWEDGLWGDRIRSAKSRIGIHTSGTTQRPRLIYHSLASLMRAVRRGPRHADDRWGLCYDPARFAGLQVVLQAVCNQNTLVHLFGLETNGVANAIDEFGITHLSATPTFFRLLCNLGRSFPTVRRATLGGEIVDQGLLHNLQLTFPNAKLRNIYASTEVGSLLESSGSSFQIPEHLADKIKVFDCELLVHNSLLAFSVQSTESDNLPGDLRDFHRTGDCVQAVGDSPLEFRFVARRTDLINVGGYKVNPHEVERALLNMEEIASTRVYGKKNSVTGQVVCCDVVPAKSLAQDAKVINAGLIRARLGKELKPHELPRIVNVVAEIQMTGTGKKSRRP